MRIDVLTLFPPIFNALNHALTGKALAKKIVDLHLHDLRDFTTDRSRKVDDEPYGGGPGMVLMLPPLVNALEHVRSTGPSGRRPWTIMTSPQGKPLQQKDLERLSEKPWILFLCGRYEGFDERIRKINVVDEEISIGDYVLGGGEIPAMVIVEGLVRLIPGVVGNRDSVIEDSFTDLLLDHPHYTRPPEFLDWKVPEILLHGNNEAIARWRRREALRRTLERRPDLLEKADLTGEEREFLTSLGWKGKNFS